MYEYLDESIKNGITLKITTSKGKKMYAKVIMYSSDMLWYKLENRSESSRIYMRNIQKVEFANHDDEKAFRAQKLDLPFNTDKFISYYKDCVEKLESETNYEAREKMFNSIFDSLYKQNSENLLVRFLKNQKEIKKILNNRKIFLLSQSNLSQRIAIKNALSSDISIIQGPPGTGKTTTILSLIANFIMEGKNVVVVSKNNSAIDNIIEEYEKTSLPEFYLRFGRKEKYMDPLQKQIPSKLFNLKNKLREIDNSKENYNKLYILQQKLEALEKEIDELINIKNLIVDLKTQKKFMDREQKLYNFRELLTENELRIITEKNATKKKLSKIFAYVRKHKFNFFQRLIIRYYYCMEEKDANQKFYAIFQLLKEVYIKKEIADKEAILLKNKLEEKQKRVKNIYQEYVSLCMKVFKSRLKEKMSDGLRKSSSDELTELAFKVYPLILTTADAFLYNFKDIIKNDKKIDVVIIDEASQCDVITGIPLLYAAKKLVVVGDEKQLSAITNLEIKTDIPREYRYNDNTFLNCVKNVFEPLEKTLEEHYRCDFNIINFCNKFYYDNQLKIYTDASNSAISIVNADKYKGAEIKDSSFCNEREIYTLKSLVDRKSDFFVITPFKSQGKELKSEYGDKRAGTIHTFQGKGANDVYFSTVLNDLSACNNHIKSEHNLFTSELVNVAVSRAKKKFVIVTDEKYFQKNSSCVKDISHLIDYIKIYGDKLDDKTVCSYDYLYKNIRLYKKNDLYDNEYEEVTHKLINSVLEGTPYTCFAKKFLTELIQNESFLEKNPIIKRYILNQAHADFSIFDTRVRKLKMVIELDGKDHYKPEQIVKDGYKHKAFEAIDIPLIRIRSKEAMNKEILTNKLKEYIEIEK